MSETELYLVWSYEHDAWWGPDGHGYFTALSKAGRYSRADALAICAQSIPGDAHRMGQFPEMPVRLADMEAVRDLYLARHPALGEPWEAEGEE